MAHQRVTGPAIEPITLAEAKVHLRVDIADEDAYITGLIQAAREAAEDRTERALITSTWRVALDAFPATIYVPVPRLQEVTLITYLDAAGATQTLAESAYRVDSVSEPARITPVDTWPETLAASNAVVVSYTAGYGHAAADVPMAIKQWMLLQIGAMYANREREIVSTSSAVTLGFADGLLEPYRSAAC